MRQQDSWTVWFFVAPNGFALAMSLAVNRSVLYEIDRLMSRTISYTLVSGLLVGLDAGSVTLVTRVLPRSSTVGVAASTLVVASLFNPVRRRVQRLVDRRFNRARDDAEATVAAFSSRLWEALDFPTMQRDLLDVVHDAFEPAHALVWMAKRRGA